MADIYNNFEELKANEIEGVDYQIIYNDINSDISCIAPHGGSIEGGSSELVDEVAGTIYNAYKFEGIKKSGNSTLHITSTNFDEPNCLSIVAKSKKAISFHGASGDVPLTYVGGMDKALCQSVIFQLSRAGFTVAESPSHISGAEPNNFINKNISGMGCQLELSTAQRQAFFKSGGIGASDRKEKTETFYTYANAIKKALQETIERKIDSNTTVKMNFNGNIKNGRGVVGENYITSSKLEQTSESITSTVSKTYATKNELNDLTIGGTNLIGNSAPNSLSGWLASDNWELSLVDCDISPSNYAIRSTNINAINGGLTKIPIDKNKLVNEEEYTMSGWVRASKECKVRFSNLMMLNYKNFVTVTTEWQYFTHTGKIDTNSSLYANSVFVHSDSCEPNMWIEVHSLKLEKGSKATDWNCASEDLEKSISQVEQTANKINWLVKSGTSSSNMELTDNMLSLTTKHALIDARKIELNGSVNINKGLYRVLTNGNTKIGGETGYTVEGFDRARFEITSNGTLFSTSHEQDQCYTKISEGYIKCNHSDEVYTIIKGDEIKTTNLNCDYIHPRIKSSLTLTDGDLCTLKLRTSNGNSYFSPIFDGVTRLGSSNYRWHSVWANETRTDTLFSDEVKTTNLLVDSVTPNAKSSLTLSDNNSCTLLLRTIDGNSYFNPSTNGVTRLGSSSYKWHSIWSTATSLNSTSDKRFKEDIKPIDKKIENMFMDIEPVNYKMKMYDDGRVHNGFIAQQVEEAMIKNNVSYNEFAGLIKNEVEPNSDLAKLIDNEDDYEYSLAYGEFTALNTHMIQELYKKIEQLEDRIKHLELEIEK